MGEPMESKTYLQFSIGPVQDFIAGARTVRDLWSGSYILSWLTAHAMAQSIRAGCPPVMTHYKDNPLVRLALEEGAHRQTDGRLLSSLPNTFTAETPEISGEALDKLGASIQQVVRDEWFSITEAVRTMLGEQWRDYIDDEWHARWQHQVDHFWDLRVGYLPGDCDAKDLAISLGIKNLPEDDFGLRMMLLGRISAAAKGVRHYPMHETENTRTPKDSLRGDFSQMIPVDLLGDDLRPLAQHQGERLTKRDRFSAISLVKRFAWSAYFSENLKVDPRKKRTLDTATIASLDWLNDDGANETLLKLSDLVLNPGDQHWSGHWLHWTTPDQGAETEEDKCDPDLFKEIATARKQFGRPPAYYAILMLDGDHMGQRLMNSNLADQRSISQALSKFSLNNVPKIIETEKKGVLVYAGGDDVLALLPIQSAIKTAISLRDKLGSLEIPDGSLTASAGLAIVHYKYNLREAIEAARQAEQIAKKSGRDRLALSILRRSGEHTTAVLPWEAYPLFQFFLTHFLNEKSDRWTYQLRSEFDRLLGPDGDKDLESTIFGPILDAEVIRLLNRSESWKKSASDGFQNWSNLEQILENKGLKPLSARREALKLIQSASFLSRPGEEG